MPGINLAPYPSKFLVNKQDAGSDKFWSRTTTYDDLLFARGQHVKDYADLSHLAKGLAISKLGITLSDSLSPLYEFVTGGGGVETVDKNMVRWRIYGEPDRRALSFGNPNAGCCPGTAGFPFSIRLDVDWYSVGDVLAPVRNKRIQIKILSETSTRVDGGYEYEAKLIDDDDAAYVPPEFFTAGEYWIKLGSLTSHENAGEAGTIQFGEGFSYIEFEADLTTMMWMFEVQGEAHRQWGNVMISRCDESDRPIETGSKITNYIEARANAQIEQEKEFFLTYGTESRHLLDTVTGEQQTTGPGLFSFLDEGNKGAYSPEYQGVDFIMDRVKALWFDRVPIANRHALFLTGEAGLDIFSEWVNEKFKGTAATYDYNFVLNSRQSFDPSSDRKGFGFAQPHFVEYSLPTFGKVTLAHWPILDNTRINAVKYPGTYYPVSSYEFITFNIGFGEPNVKFLSRVDNQIETYIPGFWSPLGATGMDNPVFKYPALKKESYEWYHKESFGLILLDPSSTLWFRPNVSY